jgi:hypothetical protein
MGCKPTKEKAMPKKMSSSFRAIAVNGENMLYRDIVKASARQKLTRAKMKIKILGKLKKQISK